MADVLLQIGLDVSEAKRGHDQIIAYNQDIARSYSGIIEAMGKITPAQARVVAEIEKTKRAEMEAATAAAANAVKAEQNALKREAAERRVSAAHKEQIQTIHQVISATTGLGTGFKSAKDSADVFARVMPKMGNAANQTGMHFSNMRSIAGQAGLQIADLAIVSQMGAQAIGQMGIQVGQFLGVLGPTGAIAGAAVTILGVLAGSYVNLSGDTEKAKEEQEKFTNAIDEAYKSVDRYYAALDKLEGRTSTWRKEQKNIEDLRGEIVRLEVARDKLTREKTGSFGLIQPGPDAFREIDMQLLQARAALFQAERAPKQAQQLEAKKLVDDMTAARERELKVADLANNSREREAKAMEAEAAAREKLKNSGLSTTEIENQVRLEGEKAAAIYDLEEQRKAREKSTREAETERKRSMAEMTRETERIAKSQDAARGSVDEYVTSINRQREALGMSERDAAIYRAGLEASDKLTKAGIQNVEELAAAQERAGKAAAALYDEQQARGKVLSKDQIRGMAAQFSPDVAYQLQVQNVQKYREQLIELGVTEDQIAYAIEDANLRKLESSREWTDGATAALMRYSRDASNYSSMASRFVTSSLNSMENALVGLSMGTETAASAFKKMAASIIQDLISMQVRARITGPLSGMLSGVVSSGFGNIGTAFQYGTNIGSEQTAMLAAQNAGFNAYASGTDYAQSGLAIVGEEGPELMQLGGGERIYPAGETAAILSGKAANSNMGGSGSLSIAEGAIVVNAPGASAEDAAIIAQQVATAVVQQAAPQIVKASVQQSLSASKSAADRGGSYAQAMGRR